MLDLDGTEEYSNMGALYGLEGPEGEDLLGALNKMNPLKRQKAINTLTSQPAPSKGSRAEMEKHFGELPPHIKAGLKNGELRLADTVIYSIKKVAGKTIKLFETQDTKQISISSVSGAKLPKNQALVVSGITILVGVSADLTPEKIMATNFDKIESFPSIANGEFNLKSNKKIILPESGMFMFKTAANGNVPAGYYKLANPRLIHDDVLIEATIELGSMEGITANTHIYLGLHGTITTP